MKTVTLRQVLEAIQKNGLPKIQKQYFMYNDTDGKANGACAIGQAAINLNVSPASLRREFADLVIGDDYTDIMAQIVYDNDNTDMTFEELANKYLSTLSEKDLNEVVVLDEVYY